MRNYRPLLLQKLEVQLPGVRLRRLRLHRHLPQTDALADHSHSFAQILCYVSGRGAVRTRGRLAEVGPGSVVFVPPGCVHGFKEPAGRRPLTVAIDFTMRGAAHREVEISSFSGGPLAALKFELSALARLHAPGVVPDRILLAATSLKIFDVCLRALGWFGPAERPAAAHVRALDRVLAQPGALDMSLGELAARTGFDRDYLSRKIKETTGLTLRERRDAARIERAKRLLRQGRLVREAAAAAGIADQNYFARWFRKHTGIQPSRFRD